MSAGVASLRPAVRGAVLGAVWATVRGVTGVLGALDNTLLRCPGVPGGLRVGVLSEPACSPGACVQELEVTRVQPDW
jgi:hypothetical protein